MNTYSLESKKLIKEVKIFEKKISKIMKKYDSNLKQDKWKNT